MKDKTSITIALLGLLISAGFWKSDLNKMLLNFGSFNLSLLDLILITLILLVISIYFYSIDYIKYGFESLLSLRIFRIFIFLGNFFYLLAIISPFIYLIIWAILKLISLLTNNNLLLPITLTVTSLVSILSIGFTMINSIKLRKTKISVEQNRFYEKATETIINSNDLYNQERWNLYFVNIFRALKYDINQKLVYLELDYTFIPFQKQLDLLNKIKALTVEETDQITKFNELATKVESEKYNFTKVEVDKIADFRRQILPKLQNKEIDFRQLIINQLIYNQKIFNPDELLSESSFNEFDLAFKKKRKRYLLKFESSLSLPAIEKKLKDLSNRLKNQQYGFLVIKFKPNTEIILPKNTFLLNFNKKTGLIENSEVISALIK